MSKKNEKRKRNLEREKANARTAIVPMIAAIVFLALGAIGFFRNSGALKEYEASADIRVVEAAVTDTKCTDNTVGDRTWYTHLRYEVDGRTYNDTATLHTHSVNVGERVDVEVYQRPNGEYAIPEITNSSELAAENILNILSLAVGAVLMAASVVWLASSLRKIKALESKIQPDEKENA